MGTPMYASDPMYVLKSSSDSLDSHGLSKFDELMSLHMRSPHRQPKVSYIAKYDAYVPDSVVQLGLWGILHLSSTSSRFASDAALLQVHYRGARAAIVDADTFWVDIELASGTYSGVLCAHLPPEVGELLEPDAATDDPSKPLVLNITTPASLMAGTTQQLLAALRQLDAASTQNKSITAPPGVGWMRCPCICQE